MELSLGSNGGTLDRMPPLEKAMPSSPTWNIFFEQNHRKDPSQHQRRRVLLELIVFESNSAKIMTKMKQPFCQASSTFTKKWSWRPYTRTSNSIRSKSDRANEAKQAKTHLIAHCYFYFFELMAYAMFSEEEGALTAANDRLVRVQSSWRLVIWCLS